MGKKAAGKGKGGQEGASSEEALLEAPVNEEEFKALVTVFVPDHEEVEEGDNGPLPAFVQYIKGGVRPDFVMISMDDVTQWIKENKAHPFAAEAKPALDAGQSLPVKICALVVKVIILELKGDIMEEMGENNGSGKGASKGKGPSRPGSAFSRQSSVSKNRKRFSRSASASSQISAGGEPENGPDVYFLLYGFVNVEFFNILRSMKVPIDSFCKLLTGELLEENAHTKPSEVEELADKETSITKIPQTSSWGAIELALAQDNTFLNFKDAVPMSLVLVQSGSGVEPAQAAEDSFNALISSLFNLAHAAKKYANFKEYLKVTEFPIKNSKQFNFQWEKYMLKLDKYGEGSQSIPQLVDAMVESTVSRLDIFENTNTNDADICEATLELEMDNAFAHMKEHLSISSERPCKQVIGIHNGDQSGLQDVKGNFSFQDNTLAKKNRDKIMSDMILGKHLASFPEQDEKSDIERKINYQEMKQFTKTPYEKLKHILTLLRFETLLTAKSNISVFGDLLDKIGNEQTDDPLVEAAFEKIPPKWLFADRLFSEKLSKDVFAQILFNAKTEQSKVITEYSDFDDTMLVAVLDEATSNVADDITSSFEKISLLSEVGFRDFFINVQTEPKLRPYTRKCELTENDVHDIEQLILQAETENLNRRSEYEKAAAAMEAAPGSAEEERRKKKSLIEVDKKGSKVGSPGKKGPKGKRDSKNEEDGNAVDGLLSEEVKPDLIDIEALRSQLTQKYLDKYRIASYNINDRMVAFQENVETFYVSSSIYIRRKVLTDAYNKSLGCFHIVCDGAHFNMHYINTDSVPEVLNLTYCTGDGSIVYVNPGVHYKQAGSYIEKTNAALAEVEKAKSKDGLNEVDENRASKAGSQGQRSVNSTESVVDEKRPSRSQTPSGRSRDKDPKVPPLVDDVEESGIPVPTAEFDCSTDSDGEGAFTYASSNGLVCEYLMDGSVKQFYPSSENRKGKQTSIENPTADELRRCCTRDGVVIRTLSNKTVEVLYHNGQICRSVPSDEETSSGWICITPEGKKYHLTTEFAVLSLEELNYMCVKNAEIKGYACTREDLFYLQTNDQGETVVEFADGTRITTYLVKTVQKPSQDPPRSPTEKSDYSANEEPPIASHRANGSLGSLDDDRNMHREFVESQVIAVDQDEEGSIEKHFKYEHPRFACVDFYVQGSESVTSFSDGALIVHDCFGKVTHRDKKGAIFHANAGVFAKYVPAKLSDISLEIYDTEDITAECIGFQTDGAKVFTQTQERENENSNLFYMVGVEESQGFSGLVSPGGVEEDGVEEDSGVGYHQMESYGVTKAPTYMDEVTVEEVEEELDDTVQDIPSRGASRLSMRSGQSFQESYHTASPIEFEEVGEILNSPFNNIFHCPKARPRLFCLHRDGSATEFLEQNSTESVLEMYQTRDDVRLECEVVREGPSALAYRMVEDLGREAIQMNELQIPVSLKRLSKFHPADFTSRKLKSQTQNVLLRHIFQDNEFTAEERTEVLKSIRTYYEWKSERTQKLNSFINQEVQTKEEKERSDQIQKMVVDKKEMVAVYRFLHWLISDSERCESLIKDYIEMKGMSKMPLSDEELEELNTQSNNAWAGSISSDEQEKEKERKKGISLDFDLNVLLPDLRTSTTVEYLQRVIEEERDHVASLEKAKVKAHTNLVKAGHGIMSTFFLNQNRLKHVASKLPPVRNPPPKEEIEFIEASPSPPADTPSNTKLGASPTSSATSFARSGAKGSKKNGMGVGRRAQLQCEENTMMRLSNYSGSSTRSTSCALGPSAKGLVSCDNKYWQEQSRLFGRGTSSGIDIYPSAIKFGSVQSTRKIVKSFYVRNVSREFWRFRVAPAHSKRCTVELFYNPGKLLSGNSRKITVVLTPVFLPSDLRQLGEGKGSDSDVNMIEENCRATIMVHTENTTAYVKVSGKITHTPSTTQESSKPPEEQGSSLGSSLASLYALSSNKPPMLPTDNPMAESYLQDGLLEMDPEGLTELPLNYEELAI
eukprot:Nk52_evm3s2542 gene=Nk52_evmTU3s2542